MTTYSDIKDKIQTGDIFLFHGPGLESELIEVVDGTSFSHVAMGVRLPGHTEPLLWTSDEIVSLTDQIDQGKRGGVHLLDAKSVFEVCMERKYKNNKHYKFAWRSLENVARDDAFMKLLETFMREVDGRAFPSLEEMVIHFIEGKLGIETNTRTFFCSELATDTYVHLELLPSDTIINSLSPGDFSSAHKLPLQKGAQLGNEVFFKLD